MLLCARNLLCCLYCVDWPALFPPRHHQAVQRGPEGGDERHGGAVPAALVVVVFPIRAGGLLGRRLGEPDDNTCFPHIVHAFVCSCVGLVALPIAPLGDFDLTLVGYFG
jgi:hypothetical protein